MDLNFFENDIFLAFFKFKPQHYNVMNNFKTFQDFLKTFVQNIPKIFQNK